MKTLVQFFVKRPTNRLLCNINIAKLNGATLALKSNITICKLASTLILHLAVYHHHNTVTLANAEKEVARNSALLNEERKNLEHIKSTLSTEIVTLRKRLVEGEPCPVCGSRHHEIASTVGETLSEKELEKATRTTEEQIEHIAKIIDNYRIEVAQLKTSIENYNNIYTERLKVTKEILQSLPDVDEKVNSLEFATMLNELSQEWDNKRERLAATREKLSQSQSSYSFKIALCNELQIRISEKEEVGENPFPLPIPLFGVLVRYTLHSIIFLKWDSKGIVSLWRGLGQRPIITPSEIHINGVRGGAP